MRSITLRIFITLSYLFLGLMAFSQAPQGIPYQAIARDINGSPLVNQNVALRFSLRNLTANGTIIYQETQNVTTSSLGLFSINLGQGTPIIGTLAAVNWANGEKFLQVELDPNGGSNYTTMGTTQLMSVPYALHAATSLDNKWTANGNAISNNNTGNVGIGTSSPGDKLAIRNGGISLHSPTNDVPYVGMDYDATTDALRMRSNNASSTLNTTQVTIKRLSGNVGIGTTNPADKLEVVDNIRLSNNNGTTTKWGLETIESGAFQIIDRVKQQRRMIFNDNGNIYLGGTAINKNGLQSTMTLDTLGRVGIGTTAPATTLDVNGVGKFGALCKIGTNVAEGYFQNGQDGAYRALQTGGTQGYWFQNYNGVNTSMYVGLNGAYQGKVGIGTVTPSNNLSIAGNMNITGKTGFGTDTPATRLDVRYMNAGASIPTVRIYQHNCGNACGQASGSSLQLINDNGTGVDQGARLSFADMGNVTNNNEGAATIHLVERIPASGNGGLAFSTRNSGNTLGERMRISREGNIGIGTANPQAKLDVNGTIRITDGSEGIGKVLTSDAFGNAAWSANPGVTGNGSVNLIPKWTVSGSNISLSNSQIVDDGTNVGIGGITDNLYKFRVINSQLTSNGDGQAGIYGFRTRDSQNDGFGYNIGASNAGITGYNFWGDVYSFGVSGFNYNDFTRCGGTYGASQQGNYWGSLGYRSGAAINYGVYGSAAYQSGAGFLSNSELNGIGGGFFGSIGAVSKGSVIGQFNEGELFAVYNKGDVYTSGKQIELVTNKEQVDAAYTVTSSELKVYHDGKIQLVNGSAYVRFDEKSSHLMGDVPTVTVSPMGDCNGLYVSEVSKEGFIVKESNKGKSNVEVSWIAISHRIDHSESKIPSMLTQPSFNRNLSRALFNDANTQQNGLGMWWDGKVLQFGETPKQPILTEAQKMEFIKTKQP